MLTRIAGAMIMIASILWLGFVLYGGFHTPMYGVGGEPVWLAMNTLVGVLSAYYGLTMMLLSGRKKRFTATFRPYSTGGRKP
jgi:hypothetical protein